MKPCEEYPDLMMKQLDGALNLAEQSALEGHLRGCQRCASEYGYLRMADGLLRAVDAPKVSAQEWAAVGAEVTKAAAAEDELGLVATATEPPPVSKEEWDGVWRGIEREALLQSEETKTIDIAAARKRSVWRYAGGIAAAAAVVALGVYIVVTVLFAPPLPPKPEMVADKVEVGQGYAYSTVKTESDQSIYIIAPINNIEYVTASTEGDFLHSTTGGVVNIAPKSAVGGGDEAPIVVPSKP